MPTGAGAQVAAVMDGCVVKLQLIGDRADLDDLCAPRGALLCSPRSGHGLEEVSLDLMADP